MCRNRTYVLLYRRNRHLIRCDLQLGYKERQRRARLYFFLLRRAHFPTKIFFSRKPISALFHIRNVDKTISKEFMDLFLIQHFIASNAIFQQIPVFGIDAAFLFIYFCRAIKHIRSISVCVCLCLIVSIFKLYVRIYE